MSSVVVQSTIQAASLAGLSNLLAQIIQAYRTDKSLSLDYVTLLRFVVYSLLATPPNLYWQSYLEKRYPANHVDKEGNKKLQKGNTAIKFVLDQTLGAIVNGYLFIAGIGALKGKDISAIWADCQRVSNSCPCDSTAFLFERCQLMLDVLGCLASCNIGLDVMAVGITLVLHSCPAQSPSGGWKLYRCFLGRFLKPVGSRLTTRLPKRDDVF